MGRRSRMTQKQQDEARARHLNGETNQQLCQFFGVSPSTMTRILARERKSHEKSHDVQFIQTDKLSMSGRNARVHSDDQISQIIASIRRFGFRFYF